jgi:hypothetical protein
MRSCMFQCTNGFIVLGFLKQQRPIGGLPHVNGPLGGAFLMPQARLTTNKRASEVHFDSNR